MKHYLNVCDVNGATVEPVDLITFGSPCQDLSVAGKRAGLKHESNGDDETTRSGLFMEAVRIIKEMRKEDEVRRLQSGRTDKSIRPRFAVWENVPGAFSSNKGEDFRVVLEELARIKDKEVSIPLPNKGKWQSAGEIIGDGWSIAWRTLDAQYHGVPQRRRRIFLVADFADQCAGEILLECQGLPGYPSESIEKGQGTAGDTSESTGGTGERIYGYVRDYGGNIFADITPTLESRAGTGGNNQPMVCVPYTLKIRSGVSVDANGKQAGKGALIQTDKSATLSVSQDQTLFQPICMATQQGGAEIATDLCPTITAAAGMSGNNQPVVCLQGSMIGRKDENGPQGDGINVDKAFTLNTIDRHAVAYGVVSKGNGEAFLMEEKHMSLACGGGQAVQGYPAICEPINAYGIQRQLSGVEVQEEVSPTILAAAGESGNNKPLVAYGICSYESNSMKSDNPHSGIYVADKARTLDLNGGNPACNQGGIAICEPLLFENHSQDTRYRGPLDTAQPVTANYGMGGNNQPFVVEPITYQKVTGPLMANSHPGSYTGQDAYNDMLVTEKKCYTIDDTKMGNTYVWEEQANTLAARDFKGPQCVCYAIDREAFSMGVNFDRELGIRENGISQTLVAAGPSAVCYALDRASFNQGENAQYDFQITDDEVMHTLVARGPGAICYKPEIKYIVRRLTPTECARLQGMPDLWCLLSQIDDMSDEDYEFWKEAHKVNAEINGKTYREKTKEQMIKWYNGLQADSSEYKAYGNGMALPCVRVPIHGIAKHGVKTMASLFDGIGGFPLAGLLDGIETLWTSEIELFPIAVTLERFREYEKYGYFTFGKE